MLPVDIQVNETLHFILEKLPPERQRILEIGCGTGELALELQSCGHEVVALDSSEENVRRALRLGVDARYCIFPHYNDIGFDAIIFSRSLHHIHPLGMSLDRANDLLEPDGLLFVEDFTFDKAGPESLAWLFRMLRMVEACGGLYKEKLGSADEFGRGFLKSGGDQSFWTASHDPDLNNALDMLDNIAQRFELIDADAVPYLYRYIAEVVPQNEYGGTVVEEALQMERYYSSAYFNFLIGRRFVARKMLIDEPTWQTAGFDHPQIPRN